MTAAGYARRFTPEHLVPAARLNGRGRSLLSRREARGLGLTDDGAWALTNHHLTRFVAADMPLSPSTRTHPILKLAPGERVLAVLSERK
jgi:hypothetical protein